MSAFRLRLTAVLMLALTSCGSGSRLKEQLIGTWEALDANSPATVEFTRDGDVNVGGHASALADAFTFPKFAALLSDFGLRSGPRVRIAYEVKSSDHIQISADATALAEALTAGRGDVQPAEALKRLRSSEHLAVSIKDDELTLTSGQGKSKRFRKLR